MTDARAREVSNPFEIYETGHLVPNPSAGDRATNEVTNTTTGATIASGFYVLRDIVSPPFTPWYDTILFLHACEGELDIEYGGSVRRIAVGGVAWIRAGSTVVFHAQGGASTLLYAVTPADWRFRAPDSSPSIS